MGAFPPVPRTHYIAAPLCCQDQSFTRHLSRARLLSWKPYHRLQLGRFCQVGGEDGFRVHGKICCDCAMSRCVSFRRELPGLSTGSTPMCEHWSPVGGCLTLVTATSHPTPGLWCFSECMFLIPAPKILSTLKEKHFQLKKKKGKKGNFQTLPLRGPNFSHQVQCESRQPTEPLHLCLQSPQDEMKFSASGNF